MAADIPTKEPTEFTAGDSVKWTRTLGDYPASTYTLLYSLRGTAGTFDITATADGDDYSISIPAPTTSGYGAGYYDGHGYAVIDGTAQVDTITLAGDDTTAADTYNLTINGSTLTTAVSFDTDLTTTATAIKTAIIANAAMNALVSVEASSNVLTLTAKTAGTPNTITTTVTDGGGTAAAATVANVTPNVYNERYLVWSGRIKVLVNLEASGSGYDGRTHVKKVLDAIEAVLESRASKEVLESNVEGVALKRIPHAELLELREKYLGYYKHELAAENLDAGLASGRMVLTRFKST
jgi:hypothetical protein|tara:strand:- start:741 stop:1625 length:885 start_codon:yes stop_codon:yes gene_type:complete